MFYFFIFFFGGVGWFLRRFENPCYLITGVNALVEKHQNGVS